MSLMVSVETLDRLRAILGAIPHPNGAALQFIGFSGKGMRLQIMNHL